MKKSNPVNTSSKFRYVNLTVIFDYMTNNDPEMKEVKRRKEDILHKMNNLALTDAGESAKKNDPDKEKQYRKDLSIIRENEDHYKSLILNRIDRAIEKVVQRSDIDFVFNIGEGVVYARKEYDITEDVLREIMKEKERSAPVSK